MDTSRINELKNRANTVKNASQEGENSATRVGQLIYDIIDYDGEQSNAITTLERKSDTMQGQINEIIEGGGGGGGGTAGKQKVFFTNITHDVVPDLPAVSDYVSSNNTFVHDSQVWTETNTNPEENQDTYMMWSWFVSTEPQSTSGPVRIYNGGQGGTGSNGEDANEIEWIYRRVQIKPTAEILNTWTEALENAKGSATDKSGKPYTEEDAIPLDWEDHPTGIDENNKYEYASYRTSTIDSATGKRKWGETGFSAPILWSAYGERGTDGDGVEYIFYADKDGRLNPDPVNYPPGWTNDTNFQDPEYIRSGSSWVDEPVDLGAAGYGQGTVQWVSMRKKQNSVWQAYSEPAVWSRLGKDGVVDGYTVDLSNENMPVGTSSDGTVSDWSNSSLVQVFHNSTPLTYDGSSTTPTAGHFNYVIGTITRSDGESATGFSASKSNDTVIVSISTITNFNEVSATVPITIYLPGNITRYLVITVFGLATGEVGQFIDMAVGSKVIRSNYEGTTVTPSSMKVGVTIGDKTYWSTYGSPEGSAEAMGYYFAYGYDGAIPEVHAGDIPLYAGHSSLTVNMYKTGSGYEGMIIDSETIPIIKDGKNGEDSPYYVEDYGISASRTDHSDITDWRPTQPTPTSEKPYVWKRSRLYNPSTQTYGDPIYVCLTGEVGPGGDGKNGKDGWMILASPANVILTQSLDNTSRFSSATVSFMAKKGNVTVNIDSISSPTGVYFDVEKSGRTVVVKSPLPFGDSYYTEGSFKVNIYVTDPDTNSTVTFADFTVPCYANLLGTWKQSVEAGEEEIAASKIVYAFGASGSDIETIKTDYNSKRNSIGNYEEWSRLDNTLEGSKTWMNNHISTAEQNISTIQRNTVTRNLLNRGKWFTNDNNFPYADYDAANDRWYDGDHSVDDIYSPIARLKKGKYCFYGYIPSSSHFDNNNISLQKHATSSNPAGTESLSPYDVGGISTDTIKINNKTYERWYAIFNLDEDDIYCSVNLYGDANHSDVAVPCLCEGESPSIDSSTSMIKQTADAIKMSVSSGYHNFILNPKATDATIGVGEMTEEYDNVMGNVMNVYNQGSGDFQLSCKFDEDNRSKLANKTVTCYAVVKPMSIPSSGSAMICFGIWGDSSIYQKAALITVNSRAAGVVDSVDTSESGGETGMTAVGNGWYVVWATFNASSIFSGIKTNCGINSVNGSRWLVYGYGVLIGETCPGLGAILTNTGLRSAGINIENGIVNLYGDKVTFSDKDGGNTNKIWIDPDDGTLHAKNGAFSGTVNANLFYGRTLTVTTSPYTIDPSTNPYNMYLYNNPTTDSQLYLPNAATYDGLEINVFVVPPTIGMSKVVRVYAGSGTIYAMNNYHIAKDDSSDNGIVVRGYDADASLFTTSYVVLRAGVKYTFKSINGTWYVLDGLCNSSDS